MNKKNILFLLLILFIITGCKKNSDKLYEEDFKFLNNDIHIKIYTNSKDKANIVFDKIDNIYHNYEEAVKENEKITNIKITDKKISNELSKLIKTGLDWYEKSDGLININKGDLIDLWNDYKDKLEIPSSKEIENLKNDISNIKLNNNYLNGTFNLNFDDYIYGQAFNDIKDYLNGMHIKNYFVNSNGYILVGSNYDKDNYNLLLENPFDSTSNMISVNNKYIVTKSIYYNSYEYDNELYSNILNPKTGTLTNEMVSVTVICDDPIIGDILATILFMSNYEDGYKLANKYNVQAIWYYYDELGNEITKEFR